MRIPLLLLLSICVTVVPRLVEAATLEERLLDEGTASLASATLESGDARRGAVLYYRATLACRQCHGTGSQTGMLGPSLAPINETRTTEDLIQSILQPSKAIRKGYETYAVETADGQVLTGLLIERTDQQVILREGTPTGETRTLAADEIESLELLKQSIMPAGVVNQLASRQQFLDLARYIIAISTGGQEVVRELEPPPALYAAPPLPEYEQRIDHAGILASLDDDSFERGERIYNRLCLNCHGTQDRPGSLPTSLRFAAGKFKNGTDPFTMYQTLTHGFGMMVPQTWMVPQQKYDVIHYIREAYLKPLNRSQYFRLDEQYLAGLPDGDTRGPEPSNIEPWSQMDYGPNLVGTYEIGDDGSNIAYKGNAIRLDPGPGGVSQGKAWAVYDLDTMRLAGAWEGEGFVDWNGINFNGRHGIHPRAVGQVAVANPTAPGWANPQTASFDEVRLRGRDQKPYGPLPRSWAQYRGMHYHGHRIILRYTVGETEILESPAGQLHEERWWYQRILNLGPRAEDLYLQVAHFADGGELSSGSGETVRFTRPAQTAPSARLFAGDSYAQLNADDAFDLQNRDFAIVARIRTTKDGTIWAKTADEPEWVPNGRTLFIRGGRLCFDIGWVGVVQSRHRIDDGKPHLVGVDYDHRSGRVRLMVDGKQSGAGKLQGKASIRDAVVRIGYTAADFPRPQSLMQGHLEHVAFFQRQLRTAEWNVRQWKDLPGDAVAAWSSSKLEQAKLVDTTRHGHDATVIRGEASDRQVADLLAGLRGNVPGAEWLSDAKNLRLRIPAGKESLQFAVWFTTASDQAEVTRPPRFEDSLTLADLLDGGPPRWPERLTANVQLGSDEHPLTHDVLTRPTDNPWFCQLRLTGIDFLDGGDEAVICSWDGSVWRVRGLNALASSSAAATANSRQPQQLEWQRIASGLFQPLGIKLIDGKIYVTCRDQICILHDRNGDDEIDDYECFNNDHQVTEHFHEFAMGLQVDSAGNLYYAKSARHALKAVVPHHGTLLRVSPDGERTDIVATGFRAANGVCLNPDGTFIVTDQEGHWNPKNRINWVEENGFYGNMFGYHDVTDSSDEAMEPPLCWITNAFDRSPSELLWVESDVWKPLQGSLLNLSYGYGQVYVVPFEDHRGVKQGGMSPLPLPRFPTGIMRGRFHPRDGQLYACGMFAWAGNQQQPGGLYRIRYTGLPLHAPVGLEARPQTVRLRFSDELARATAERTDRYRVKVWSLKRTANYGSDHYNEKTLDIRSARLLSDGSTVELSIPDLAPTWCMEIRYDLEGADGEAVEGTIHNTIHAL